MKVAIVGGGIAGLAAAFRLTRENGNKETTELTLFEAGPRFGGIIQSRHENDCLIEDGPDAFVTYKNAALDLCHELGLAARLISTNASHRRAFVAFNGRLEPIPEGFMMIAPTRFDTFFKSNLFSREGKLRIACEQFIAKGEWRADESVASFVNRRLGKEALERIAQPLLGGIYTADPETLSLRATMPKFLDYEQNYGSVIAGLIAERKQSAALDNSAGARYSAFASLDGGMQILVDALVLAIGESHLRTMQEVISLRRQSDRWQLSFANGNTENFDHVLLTVPAFVAARLLSQIEPTATKLLAQIEYASSAVINLLFDRAAINHPLDGFGFVVPAVEKRKIIAATFSHVKFAGRCPADKALIRVFMGGAGQSRLLEEDAEHLIAIAKAELQELIETKAEPSMTWLKRWPQAMPQYKVGHLELVGEIEKSINALPGLHLAGASLRGVGIPDCIESANQACRRMALAASVAG